MLACSGVIRTTAEVAAVWAPDAAGAAAGDADALGVGAGAAATLCACICDAAGIAAP